MILVEPEVSESDVAEYEIIHLYDAENDPFGFIALCGEDLTDSAFDENPNLDYICPMCEAMESLWLEQEAEA